MYNKLFTKILDSSIWLEPASTRLLWLTLIAAMDEDGFAAFASVGNLAHRARLSIEETQVAIACLESPDPESSNPANEGRRIERVPGGWMVLNAPEYRRMVTKMVVKEQTRERVARHRAKGTGCNAHVTHGNAVKRKSNEKHSASVPASVLASEEEKGMQGEEKSKRRAASEQEVIEFCVSIGLPESDGSASWFKWVGNGWKNGNKGIADWKATIRSWKANGYMPSQKSTQLRFGEKPKSAFGGGVC